MFRLTYSPSSYRRLDARVPRLSFVCVFMFVRILGFRRRFQQSSDLEIPNTITGNQRNCTDELLSYAYAESMFYRTAKRKTKTIPIRYSRPVYYN